MVMYASEESGLEELQRLSREIGDRGKELVQGLGRARNSIERVKKKRVLWAVIREYKISLVLEQLEPLATPEVYKEVKSLKRKKSTAVLRRLILNLIDELEKSFNNSNSSRVNIPATNKKLKIISILLGLIFYIE
jgi:hypothetical protein